MKSAVKQVLRNIIELGSTEALASPPVNGSRFLVLHSRCYIELLLKKTFLFYVA